MKHYMWHRFIFTLLRLLVGPFIKFSMGYRCGREKKADTARLIIANHNTDIDPALVAMGFSGQMYFVASEHAFRKGFASKLLKFVFEPIPINKTHTDAVSVREVLRRLKSGASVCIFAEGNRSHNGVTGPIPPGTAKLAKISGADLVTYRLEGGYFTTPRWAANKRKGRMEGRVVGRYPAAELKSMTAGQVLGLIERDICENAYDRQLLCPARYRGKNLAEHIEIALYVCPVCKKIGTIRSEGDRFFCDCGLNGSCTETGFLEGEALPFSTITDWDRWQTDELADIVHRTGDGPICEDEGQKLFAVDIKSGNVPVGEGRMYMTHEELHCAGLTFPLRQITRIVVVGRMTMLFSLKGGAQYEVRSQVPRSALKYIETFRILCGAPPRDDSDDK